MQSQLSDGSVSMTLIPKAMKTPPALDSVLAINGTNFDIGGFMRQARVSAKVGLREIARRAGTSHATISAYERNQKIPSVATFLRILSACSYAVDISLEPRVRERQGMSRGKELEQVLELAEQFPSKPLKNINFPIFRKNTL